MAQNQIELIQSLSQMARNLRYDDYVELENLKRRTEMIVRKIFGKSSTYLKEIHNISFSLSIYTTSTKRYEFENAWERGKKDYLNFINLMLEDLGLQNILPNDANIQESQKHNTNNKRQVFVVHGHDKEMKLAVARTIEKIGLEPIILHELPDQGNTIIEKFTKHSDVEFAVVLFSPDDMCCTQDDNGSLIFLENRARQNVIFELGYFTAQLGRENVLVLLKEEVNFKIPSDIHGVLYKVYDDPNGQWCYGLVDELKSRGFDVSKDSI